MWASGRSRESGLKFQTRTDMNSKKGGKGEEVGLNVSSRETHVVQLTMSLLFLSL
jgi:hypothetical protein